MKLLLLCLGLTLVCAHHEENHDVVTSNFDTSKISGEWYTILLSSDVKEKIEENGSLRLFVENIEALDNSSLLVKCHKEIYGTCAEFNFLCDETEEEGVYSVPYDGYNTFHIVEGAYDEYLVFYILNSKDENKTQVMVFVARNPDMNLELKKRFEELGEDRGIPKENVLDLTNANPCSHVRGS